MKNKFVYVVKYYDNSYDGNFEGVEGVFSTKEKAEAHIEKQSFGWSNPWSVQEYTLDPEEWRV